MNELETFNWQEKSSDEVYDYLETLAAEDQYPFLKWLAEHAPDLEIDWLDFFEDIRTMMPVTQNIEACLEFSAWYAGRFPNEYANEFQYIERDLCDYYLFHGEIEKLRGRISFISQYPVAAIDVLTKRLLYQLIYHGLYHDAINYAKTVWRPINESDELIGFAAQPYINTIYTDGLQQCYETLKNGSDPDFEGLRRLMTELEIEEDKALFDIIVSSLKNEVDIEQIRDSILKKRDDHMYSLNIHFLKYMLDTWQMPFVFSDFIWSFISTKKIFGKYRGIDKWFYVDEKTMDKHIADRLDLMFRSNNLEIFGKVWGMHYVFKFLHGIKLLTDEHAVYVNDYLANFRDNIVKYIANDCWQMDFVFRWPDRDLWTEMKPAFDSTYDLPPQKVNLMDDRFLDIPDFPLNKTGLIREEIKESEPEELFYSGSLPYIKQEKKIGRNDSCPCGSGKKYKKCCMEKDNN